MKKLSPSGLGIIVDKNRATKTFPMRITTLSQGYMFTTEVYITQEDPGESLGKWAAITLLVIYIAIGCILL